VVIFAVAFLFLAGMFEQKYLLVL